MNRINLFCGTLLVFSTLFLTPAFSQEDGSGTANNPVFGPEIPGGGTANNPVFGPDTPGSQHQNGDAPGIPIDGGASFLAAAGAAYGMKKYRDYRKNQEH